MAIFRLLSSQLFIRLNGQSSSLRFESHRRHSLMGSYLTRPAMPYGLTKALLNVFSWTYMRWPWSMKTTATGWSSQSKKFPPNKGSGQITTKAWTREPPEGLFNYVQFSPMASIFDLDLPRTECVGGLGKLHPHGLWFLSALQGSKVQGRGVTSRRAPRLQFPLRKRCVRRKRYPVEIINGLNSHQGRHNNSSYSTSNYYQIVKERGKHLTSMCLHGGKGTCHRFDKAVYYFSSAYFPTTMFSLVTMFWLNTINN